MFVVIGIMFLGIISGFLLRRKRLRATPGIITALIWLLLFVLGVEVGHNSEVIQSLPTLGLEAFFIATLCVVGSSIAAWGLWFYLFRRKENER